MKKEDGGSRHTFYGLISKSHIHNFLTIHGPIALNGGGDHTGYEYQETRITGYQLRNWLPQLSKKIYEDSYGHGLNLATDYVLQMEI